MRDDIWTAEQQMNAEMAWSAKRGKGNIGLGIALMVAAVIDRMGPWSLMWWPVPLVVGSLLLSIGIVRVTKKPFSLARKIAGR